MQRDRVEYAMADPNGTGRSFKVTGYVGFEEAIANFRNRNRDAPKDRAYFDWRYSRDASGLEPLVFWLSGGNELQGMAALIFRTFWVNGRLHTFAVLGDISLNRECRGKGRGRLMLQYLSEYLAQQTPASPAFVIPNESARRSLEAIGWRTAGSLVPHVLMLDPTDRLAAVLPSRLLARSLGRVAGKALRAVLRRRSASAGTVRLEMSDEFDGTFDRLWQAFGKSGLILSDRSVATLTWRYARHPGMEFRVAKLMRGDSLLGYLVYEMDDATRTCSVYDVLVVDPLDLACLIARFALWCGECADVASIRIVLGEAHPYRAGLRGLGFIPREPQGVFQVYAQPGPAGLDRAQWFLMYGDKDI